MERRADTRKFLEWMTLKRQLKTIKKFPSFKDGEIWWTAIGDNIGIEINGKGKKFSRPVLVFTKLSQEGFMGIPLTSQKHSGSWYEKFEFQNEIVYAAISQARVLGAARLYDRIGEITSGDMLRIQKKFNNLYLGQKFVP